MRHQGQCQRCQQDNQHGAPALPMKFWAAGHGVLATLPGGKSESREARMSRTKIGRYKLLKKNSVQISDIIQKKIRKIRPEALLKQRKICSP